MPPADPLPRVAVSFRNVDIVFGEATENVLWLIDQGRSRDEIARVTGRIVGVKHATLDVGEGEIVVLMGLSGSGKSTLLRAVNGLTRITRGSISVFDGETDVPVQSCSPRQLRRLRRRRVAMVFQQFGLLPWRTVNENVALGLELDGMSRSARRAKVAAQLELVGLAGWGDKRVDELSGGMQQRVGLARAFANEAPILLMDEPFSALDPLIRVRLQDELLELQRRLKRTIIFVSHDLDEALKLGTRIAIMEGGEIVQIGTPQEIVLDPCSDYVRDFVAHMNPLNVLRAQEIMTPLDGADAGGVPTRTEDGAWVQDGEALPLVGLGEVADAPSRALISVERDTPLRALIQARLRHRGPYLVRDGETLCGRVRDEDLFRCLVRSERAAPPPADPPPAVPPPPASASAPAGPPDPAPPQQP